MVWNRASLALATRIGDASNQALPTFGKSAQDLGMFEVQVRANGASSRVNAFATSSSEGTILMIRFPQLAR